jgi:uncharacterized protein YjbI with pentapeptide repeats
MAETDRLGIWGEDERQRGLATLKKSGSLLLMGRRIADGQLADLATAAPQDENGAPRLGLVSFEDSVIEGDLDLGGAAIESLWLKNVVVEGNVDLSGAQIGYMSAENAKFRGDALFIGSQFDGVARLSKTTFEGLAAFGSARFARGVDFAGASFTQMASFNSSSFVEDANFAAAVFSSLAMFGDATFARTVSLRNTSFMAVADLANVSFGATHGLGPMLACSSLALDGSTFERPVTIEVAADLITMERAHFPQGAHLFARYALVTADNAVFSGPSLIAFSSHDGPDDSALESKLKPQGVRSRRPRIESLRRADVGALTLSGVDLRGCRFAGAHNLDGLRVDGSAEFASAPGNGRRVIAEEADVRAAHDHPEWKLAAVESIAGTRVESLDERDVADLYRELRKGQESRGDEPGAADFYYGEMEMRRRAKGTAGEKAVVWAYWLTSGYALRPLRAFVALLVTIALFGILLKLWGFEPRPPATDDASWSRAFLFSAESTSSLFRVPATPNLRLTEVGEVLQIFLRLLGPLFFGLLLLSIRGRVKR